MFVNGEAAMLFNAKLDPQRNIYTTELVTMMGMLFSHSIIQSTIS
jgi:hypothetical protein